MIYADIIVDISHEKVDRSFQYKVPEELQHKLQVGMAVSYTHLTLPTIA